MNHALIVFTAHWENGCYNLVVGCLSLHCCGCIHPFIISVSEEAMELFGFLLKQGLWAVLCMLWNE